LRDKENMANEWKIKAQKNTGTMTKTPCWKKKELHNGIKEKELISSKIKRTRERMDDPG
jgi:hypothetical protein